MGRNSLLRMAIGVALAILTWPKEAILGTYGSYTLVRRGYTIAKDITVGSHSDHTREAVLFQQREATIDAAVKPMSAAYDKWFARVLTGKHPYADWLAALDRTRTTALQWDYQSRLPGPVLREVNSNTLQPLVASMDHGGAAQVYLHMKADASESTRGRALVGFALAQIALGDAPEFTLPAVGIDPLAQRIAHTTRADFFSGQPRVVAALLFDVRTRQGELAQLVDDKAQTADVRLLARLCLSALRHEPWTERDWQLLLAAKGAADMRTLWTWVLIFTPATELPKREAELRQRFPLPGEYDSYDREYVKGKRE